MMSSDLQRGVGAQLASKFAELHASCSHSVTQRQGGWHYIGARIRDLPLLERKHGKATRNPSYVLSVSYTVKCYPVGSSGHSFCGVRAWDSGTLGKP